MAHNRKLSNYWGDLPRHKKGPNKDRIDRNMVSLIYGFSIRELTKAYTNWQDIFRLDGSDLTYKQYLDKLRQVRISPLDVGNKLHQYNLSRYNDDGVYTDHNCRFITRFENLAEQEH